MSGTLDATPGTTYTLEFFSNPAGASAQGRVYLGTGTAPTDAAGHAVFSVSLPVTTAADAGVTAAATDPANNTSPFSVARPSCPTRTRSGPGRASAAARGWWC